MTCFQYHTDRLSDSWRTLWLREPLQNRFYSGQYLGTRQIQCYLSHLRQLGRPTFKLLLLIPPSQVRWAALWFLQRQSNLSHHHPSLQSIPVTSQFDHHQSQANGLYPAKPSICVGVSRRVPVYFIWNLVCVHIESIGSSQLFLAPILKQKRDRIRTHTLFKYFIWEEFKLNGKWNLSQRVLTICHDIKAWLSQTFTCSSLRLHALFNDGCPFE